MAPDAMAPYVARESAAMILTQCVDVASPIKWDMDITLI